MKVMGMVVLFLFALSSGIRVLAIGFGMMAAFGALAPEAQSLAIGQLIGATLVEALIVYGLYRLIRSLKNNPAADVEGPVGK